MGTWTSPSSANSGRTKCKGCSHPSLSSFTVSASRRYFGVPAARPVDPLVTDHQQHGRGLSSGGQHNAVSFTEQLDAALSVHQVVGTIPHEPCDSISGSRTPNDATGSISHDDHDPIFEIDDLGTVFDVGSIRSGAGGVHDGEGHGGYYACWDVVVQTASGNHTVTHHRSLAENPR